MDQDTLQDLLIDWLSAPRSGRGVQRLEGAALASVPGPARELNQDRAVVAALPDGRMFAVLADGMGGLRDGAGCAARAVATFAASLTQARDQGAEHALGAAIQRANSAVYDAMQGEGGSTLTALYASAEGMLFCHVGDSRLYAFNEGVTQLLTTDNTALAALPAHEAEALPDAELGILGSQLNRAIGIAPTLTPQLAEVSGERFALTSDGLHDSAPPYGGDAEKIGSGMVEQWVDAAQTAGSRDDVSAVLVAPETVRTLATDAPRFWDCYGKA